MSQNQLANINDIEDNLWEAADQLRANSKLTSSEYCMPVLGIIFLRHATNRYTEALRHIEADKAAGRMPKRAVVKADFLKRRALLLPPEARYETLLKLPKGQSLGTALVQAMEAIERDFEPLRNQLPKDYDKFANDLLESLLRAFDSEALRTASGDVFGRIYEYFLMKFAMQGAQDNGEFFTPPSLVQTIVNVIEPDHGTVFDPACGSGGMFVQSSHFIEQRGQETMKRVTFFGQEKTPSTIRLAKMNLAVHGLEGDIRDANTFYEDVHALFNKCDFVMANPPFNVDMVDADKIKDDRRLPFGLPGVNKAKKVSNGNYLWVSYFHSYLKPGGRAGFVMSSQASSAGHAEAEVRRKLIETGDVDVMISIRANFFYTRTVPCELWHFDKGKPAQRRDQVLMLDARNIYRKVTRKIYDFSPEQMQNLTAIVWLYRGERERFLGLVQSYAARLLAEAGHVAGAIGVFQAIVESAIQQMQAYADLIKNVAQNPGQFLQDALAECAHTHQALLAERAAWAQALAHYAQAHGCETPITHDVNEAHHAARRAFEPLAEQLKTLSQHLDAQAKQVTRATQLAAELSAKLDAGEEETRVDEYDRRTAAKRLKQLDEARHTAAEPLKQALYFHKQVGWLHERFPQATLCDVPGLVKLVSRADLAAADYSLTPGRYVGVAPAEVDEDFDFEQTMREIHTELAELNAEAAGLAATIQRNFEGLGI